jgi:hypothetical protein
MNISRKKFVLLFFVFGFAFLGTTTSLLGTMGVRGFPKLPDSILSTGSDSTVAWKSATSSVLFPVKVVLLGPVAPLLDSMRHEDAPPPFLGIVLVFYWTILASAIHYLLGKLRRS